MEKKDRNNHALTQEALPGFPSGHTVPFPYETPYPQQVDLMETLLQGLRQARDDPSKASVMILESPTGTGKSLSLACAAMAWLRHQEQEDLSQKETSKEKSTDSKDSSGLDWLDAWVSPEETHQALVQTQIRQEAQSSRRALSQQLEVLRTKVGSHTNQKERVRERRENLVRSSVTAAVVRERQQHRRQHKRRRIDRSTSTSTHNNSSRKNLRPTQPSGKDDYCVDEYRSDREVHEDDDGDDDSFNEPVTSTTNGTAVTAASEFLDGSRLDGSRAARGHAAAASTTVGGVPPSSGVRKVVYAARTHSQLSQFVGELGRTAWGTSARVVALGGRQALCGNLSLKQHHKTEASLSEACLDMQQEAKKNRKKACPLVASREGVATLALHSLVHPSDIEDAQRLGQASHSCAYYASRQSLAAAEVVVLPYSMLLSRQARTAVGLSLQESLVLVDEAHNLPEAIRSLHSCRLSLPVAQAALTQLKAYTERYMSRLAGRNLHYLGQIRKCLLAFIKHLEAPTKNGSSEPPKMMSTAELLIQLKLDNINLFKILRYLEQSRLPQKLLGFSSAVTTNTQKSGAPCSSNSIETGLSKHVSSLSIVQTFLEKLTSTRNEGKVVTDWPRAAGGRSSTTCEHPTLRYVLLHPSAHFSNVLEEARAVALVGGTLRPFVHMAAELLGNTHVEKAALADQRTASNNNATNTSMAVVSPSLTTFSCDHVVSSSNVRLECLGLGPTNVKLDFRHQSRMNPVICDELGRALEEICKVVPFGVVVFLPSYAYESFLVSRWKETGLLSKLQRHKKVHREPKRSQDVESALGAYSRDAQSFGALLLSVVGGKMSEGINFSNDIARCVMVVGLPYPDITDPELKEKMQNMDDKARQTKSSITGNSYYHNLCMRAVNQSVGRAIRHANDYAAIVLADFRYSTDPRVFSALPGWLRRGAVPTKEPKSFRGSMDRLSVFFQERQREASTKSVTP